MIWLCIFLLTLCIVAYFGIEPITKYIKNKREMKTLAIKLVQDKFKREQNERNEARLRAREEISKTLQENRRQNEILRQTLSKKDYDSYMRSQAPDYVVRGGRGNVKLVGFEYGWYKGDIDDKNSQG